MAQNQDQDNIKEVPLHQLNFLQINHQLRFKTIFNFKTLFILFYKQIRTNK